MPHLRDKVAAIVGLAGFALGGCAAIGDGPGAAGQSTLESQTVIQVATAAEENGNYPTAVDVLRKGVAAHPSDVALQVKLGEAFYLAGQGDEAIKTFRAAIEAAPGRPEAHVLLGRLYLARRRPDEALAEFQAVLASDPHQLNALNGKGIALDLLNRSHEAQECYQAVLAIAPDDRAARNNLGLSLALSGAFDQAIKELSKLVEEPGATPRMRQNLALALGLKGDRSEAERVARMDLDGATAKSNMQYYDTVRGLAAPAVATQSKPAPVIAQSPPASGSSPDQTGTQK